MKKTIRHSYMDRVKVRYSSDMKSAELIYQHISWCIFFNVWRTEFRAVCTTEKIEESIDAYYCDKLNDWLKKYRRKYSTKLQLNGVS